MSKFNDFFEEPVYYEYPYGWLVDGETNSKEQAREIFFSQFTDNLVPEVHKYTKHYLNHHNSNIKEYWAKWHGYIDDDGQMSNGWVVSPDYCKKKGAKRVFGVVEDRHYFRTGHEYTHQIDEYGHRKFGWSRSNDGDCLVCVQIEAGSNE